MKRMRFLVSALVIWLFLFYNIERLSESIDIIDVAYVFVPLMAVLTLLVSRLRRIPLWGLLAMPIPVFLVLKAWWRPSVWSTSVPLTVTEVCVIAVTITLAHLVSSGLSEFESAIAHISIGQVDTLPKPFSTGQAEMYREMRRARHHERPLALVAVGIEKDSIQVALDRMVRETQQAMMKQYVLSDVAKRLCDELENYDVIARDNDHFLILLPEVTSEQLSRMVDRLSAVVSEQMGVTLQIGMASFPEDAVTFESLVEKAVGEMDGKQKRALSARSKVRL
jgi:GGDEF domain-containing protein